MKNTFGLNIVYTKIIYFIVCRQFDNLNTSEEFKKKKLVLVIGKN
jgi:hypothetical protein